jgi:hypothetical protein
MRLRSTGPPPLKTFASWSGFRSMTYPLNGGALGPAYQTLSADFVRWRTVKTR